MQATLASEAAAQPTAQPRPEPPRGAQPYERGPYDAAVLQCAGALASAVRSSFGKVDVVRYWLPADATWPQVSGHYAGGFSRADGWMVEPLPERAGDCRMRAWSNGKLHYAAALMEDAVGTPPRRALVVAYPAD